jgi:hypothetical protein
MRAELLFGGLHFPDTQTDVAVATRVSSYQPVPAELGKTTRASRPARRAPTQSGERAACRRDPIIRVDGRGGNWQ